MAGFSVTGLRVVAEVAERGSFSAAAQRLGYTQSAVSRQIALAERAAGRALFERHARGVRLTPAGVVVVRHAESVLAELEAARQDLDDLDARPPGRLRVGAFSTALAALVPRALAMFERREPQTQILLREGTSAGLLARVASRRLDVAVITPTDEQPAGSVVTPLMEDPLLVAVARGHRLAGESSVPADALRCERWIVGSRESGSTLLGPWTTASWRPEISHVVRDWTAKLGLVAAGHGVTIVPGLAAPMLPPTIAVVRIDHPAASRTTAIATQAGAPDDSRRGAFGEALRDAAAELAGEVRRSLRP